MEIIFLAFASALGLASGSFCNVLIYRLPRGESIAFPASHCPTCNAPIPWYLNVPLLSWVVLMGRCKACKSRISVRYPIVELLNGALFFSSALVWGMSVETGAAWIFCLMTVALSLIDLEHQLLPDKLTYPGIALGMAFCPFVAWTDWRSSIAGVIAGAGIPSLLIWFYALRGVEAMGWGDVKLLAMVGAFLGWRGLLMTMLFGAVAGTVIGGGYLLATRKGRRTPLPFGTFLGAAAIFSLFFQTRIWEWYTGLIASRILPTG